MNTTKGWILALGTIQAISGFVIAQDIYPLPSLLKLIIAATNIGLIFALANIKSWNDPTTTRDI